MELCLHKSLLVVSMLHLCQGQDPALPSPSSESALLGLGDVMKAAFMEVAKISNDNAVRAVSEQAVEELGPQENIAEKPKGTADDREDRLPAVAREHPDKETTSLRSETNAKQEQAQPKLNPSEQTPVLPDEEEFRPGVGLGQEPSEEPVESIYQLNNPAEESVQDPVPNLAQDLMESTQEPKESFAPESEVKSPRGQKYAEVEESRVWSFDSAPEGAREGQAGTDEGKREQDESEPVKAQEQTRDTDATEEMEKGDKWKHVVEEGIKSKIQKGGLLELAKQSEPQPDQDRKPGLVTHDDLKVVEGKQDEDEQRFVDAAGHVNEVRTGKEEARLKAHTGEESVGGEAEVEALIPVSKTSQELATDDMEETNDLNDTGTSRDPVLNWDVPTLGMSERSLPPFPTLGVELGESDELVEEPADNPQSTTPKQEAWKIGVIAIAFFLILQSLVTVTYILKCKGKRYSCAAPERVCEDGVGAASHDAENTDTDEQTTVDDLPERSQIQQETFALTPIPTQSTVEKSFNH